MATKEKFLEALQTDFFLEWMSQNDLWKKVASGDYLLELEVVCETGVDAVIYDVSSFQHLPILELTAVREAVEELGLSMKDFVYDRCTLIKCNWP